MAYFVKDDKIVHIFYQVKFFKKLLSISGVVEAAMVQPGQTVSKNISLFTKSKEEKLLRKGCCVTQPS